MPARGFPIWGIGDTCLFSFFHKRALARVAEEKITLLVVSDDQIRPQVVVEVGNCDAQRFTHQGFRLPAPSFAAANTGLGRDIGKTPLSQVAKKLIVLTTGMLRSTDSFYGINFWDGLALLWMR
jgi:hypothetical protein